MAELKEIKKKPKRLFAIGDIHGCSEELSMLLNFLEQDMKISKKDHVVFIGDYIDRGPDSKGVIESLLAFKEKHGEYTTFLKGNHEDMLLGWLGLGGENGIAYVSNGGSDCLKSYGVKRSGKPDDLLNAMPEEHLAFFQSLTGYLLCEEYVFAHAGLDPLRDLREQIDDDLYWIREEFIQNIHYFEKTVVFGHTPFEDVFFHLPYKIGLDTGLVYGNALSCIEVESEVIYQIGYGDNVIYEHEFAEKGGVWPPAELAE